MFRIKNIILTSVLLLFASGTLFAQKTLREYIRSGNKYYEDSLFVQAEVQYRKALELDPDNAIALFNLGNTMLFQKNGEEALKQYDRAIKNETDKEKIAKLYHNKGVVYQAAQQYKPAIDAYKEALRRNPGDNETRYNLALAMSQLKEEEDQDKQDQNQDQQQKEEQQQEEQKRQEQEQQQQEQQQEKQEEQQQQQQEQKQSQSQEEISEENAEMLLQSVMQDEKEIQEKMKREMQMQQGKKLEKEW